jgi:hypothetical protein
MLGRGKTMNAYPGLFLVMKTYCVNEWADYPEFCLVELIEENLEKLAKNCPQDCNYVSRDIFSYWIDDESLWELIQEDFGVVTNIPQDVLDKEDSSVEGHVFHRYPDLDLSDGRFSDGGFLFEVYNKYGGDTFFTDSIDLKIIESLAHDPIEYVQIEEEQPAQ